MYHVIRSAMHDVRHGYDINMLGSHSIKVSTVQTDSEPATLA